MNAIVIYYSYGGNTRRVAERIGRALQADLAEIRTVKPYTGSYNEVVDQGQREVNSGYLPEIEPLTADLSQYDTVILGTPVWWYTCAPAVRTFLHSAALPGKRGYPFATNGGWLGHTLQDIQKACPGAQVMSGLNLRFNGAQQRTPDAELDAWVDRIMSGD